MDLIEITLGKPSGNKKVTLIHNLDVFGIDPQEFGHKCQVGLSVSSKVNEAPKKKRSNGQPAIEVLVQGNQVDFVGNLLLEHYKIPKKYIKGLELAVEPNNKSNTSSMRAVQKGSTLRNHRPKPGLGNLS